MEAANRYKRGVCLPDFNAEFTQPALEEGSAFVVYIGADLDGILCEQHERVAGKDNCVSFEKVKMILEVPEHVRNACCLTQPRR